MIPFFWFSLHGCGANFVQCLSCLREVFGHFNTNDILRLTTAILLVKKHVMRRLLCQRLLRWSSLQIVNLLACS